MEDTIIQRVPAERVGMPVHNEAGGVVNDGSGVGTVEHGAAQVSSLHGIVAEFETPEQLLAAAEATRDAGYKKFDCFTPFPFEGLSEAMGFKDDRVPWLTLIFGVFGGVFGFLFVAWTVTQSYVYNIGGRPLYGWPQWIVPAFELTILSAALMGIGSMIVLNGLPQPYHSMFNAPGFERASNDRFFICIEADDAQFDRSSTRQFLQGLQPLTVSEVED